MGTAASVDVAERLRRILAEQISRANRLGEIHGRLRDRENDAADDRDLARQLGVLLALVDCGVIGLMDNLSATGISAEALLLIHPGQMPDDALVSARGALAAVAQTAAAHLAADRGSQTVTTRGGTS